MIVVGFLLLASTTILMLVYFDVNHDILKGSKWLKPSVKVILPIILIFVTIYVAFVIAKIFGKGFDEWIKWDSLDDKQIQLIQVDATIIAGLFILLGFAFQTIPSSHGILPNVDVKSWIIGITAPTIFPFVASVMLLTLFGLAPGKYHKTGTKEIPDLPIPKWPAKIGLLMMLLGFMWVMGDLIAIVLLLV